MPKENSATRYAGFATKEAVQQLLLALKILLLFEFKTLFAFLFLPILDCWTATLYYKLIDID